MFDTVAWSESIDLGGSYGKITTAKDPHIVTDGDKIVVGDLTELIGVYAPLGSSGEKAYLASPSLRRLNYYDVIPIRLAIDAGSGDAVRYMEDSPLSLESDEGLEFYGYATPGTAEQVSGVAFLSDGPIAPVTGEISTYKATANYGTDNASAGEWTNTTIDFRQTLPVGTYQVVGAKLVCDDGVAFRFEPLGEAYYPGGICVDGYGAEGNKKQRYGGLGAWFEFSHDRQPTIDLLASTSVTSDKDLYIDMIKTA